MMYQELDWSRYTRLHQAIAHIPMLSMIFTVSFHKGNYLHFIAHLLWSVCSGVFSERSDGKGNVLGFGGAERTRSNGLPFTGIMFFDPADIDTLSNEIALHEMGHGTWT